MLVLVVNSAVHAYPLQVFMHNVFLVVDVALPLCVPSLCTQVSLHVLGAGQPGTDHEQHRHCPCAWLSSLRMTPYPFV
jgi:hypothetical protein